MDSIFTLSVAFFPIQNSLFSWNLTCQFLLLLLQLEECLSAAPWYSWTWIFPEYFQSFRSLFKVFNPFWADFNFLEHRRKESSSCLWKTVFVKKKKKENRWQVLTSVSLCSPLFECECARLYGNQYRGFSSKQKQNCLLTQLTFWTVYTLGCVYILKSTHHRNTCTLVFFTVLFKIARKCN